MTDERKIEQVIKQINRRELPNRYGRKSSILLTERGTTIKSYPSRRQARKARATEAAALGLQPFQMRVVANGAQELETRLAKPVKVAAKKAKVLKRAA